MKKALFIVISIVIIYTGFWWRCAQTQREHVIGQLEAWKNQMDLSDIQFEYESASSHGYPFLCSTTLLNPKVTYSTRFGKIEAILLGDLSVGKKVLGKEHSIKQTGVLKINTYFADNQSLFQSNIDFVLNFSDPLKQHDNIKNFLKTLIFSNAKINLENAILAINKLDKKAIGFDSLKVTISEKKRSKATDYQADFDLKKFAFYKELLHNLKDPRLNEELLQTLGKIDLSFSINAQIPPKELLKKFLDKPSAKTLPDFKIEVSTFNNNSNLNSSRGELHFSFISSDEGKGNLKLNMDQAGELKTGYGEYLKQAIEFTKKRPDTKENAYEIAVLDILISRLIPKLPLDEHFSIEFLGSYNKKNPATYANFLDITELFKLDFGIGKWGEFVIHGKIRQKEPAWMGDIQILVKNMDHIIHTLINLHNTLVFKFNQIDEQFVINEERSPFLIKITDSQEAEIKNFFKNISLTPQDFENNWKTSIIFDGSQVTIGGKPIDEVVNILDTFIENSFSSKKGS